MALYKCTYYYCFYYKGREGREDGGMEREREIVRGLRLIIIEYHLLDPTIIADLHILNAITFEVLAAQTNPLKKIL